MTFRDGLNDDDRRIAPFCNVAGDYIKGLKENIYQLEQIMSILTEEQATIAERLISENKEHIEILQDAIFEDGKVKDIDVEELHQIFKDEREFNSTKEQELKEAEIVLPEKSEEKLNGTKLRSKDWLI